MCLREVGKQSIEPASFEVVMDLVKIITVKILSLKISIHYNFFCMLMVQIIPGGGLQLG